MGRSGDPRRRWVSTGINVDITRKYRADPKDPGPGRHLWTFVAMWTVNPGPGSPNVLLDNENLVSIQGPGCYKCERSWTMELMQEPCSGSLSPQ